MTRVRYHPRTSTTYEGVLSILFVVILRAVVETVEGGLPFSSVDISGLNNPSELLLISSAHVILCVVNIAKSMDIEILFYIQGGVHASIFIALSTFCYALTIYVLRV